VSRTQDALSLFEQGYNCAQAILAAFAPNGEASREVYLKLASSFGSGMSRTGNTCGAVSGALMVIGLHLGPSQKKRPLVKLKLERTSKKFLKEFEKRHGTVVCNPLRGHEPNGMYRKGKNDLCPAFVKTAAEILEELF
jgi:C_GCAxxG_C_C family probable redox protein